MSASPPLHPGWTTTPFAGARPRAAAPAVPRSAVNPVVRLGLYAYVASIPFELPDRTALPIEVPTLFGLILIALTVLNPGAAWRRIPGALLLFGAYLWVFTISTFVNGAEHEDLVFRLLVNMAVVVLLFWVIFNLMSDARIVRGVFLSLILATSVRAALQVLGIAATPHEEWTGGVRVTIFGQNANLSAIILSAGLIATVGAALRRDPRLPKLRLLSLPLAAVLGTAIVQTGSRGGILCALMGLIAFAFRGGRLRQRLRNGFLAIAGAAALLIGVSQSEMMRGRLEWAAEGHLAGREKIYPALITMVSERPLLGWGPIQNQFEIARRINDVRRERRDAHNLALEVFTTTGLFGAIPFFGGLLLCLASAWRARRGALGIVPLAIMAAVLTGTVSGTWIASKIVWLALAIGLAAGAHWTPRASPNGRYV